MNGSRQDIQAILGILKKTLRARGYVYADVAKKLKVSEVTIKRLFSGNTNSMKSILEICDLLQVSLLDVAAAAKKFEHLEFILNEKQDRFFSKNPSHYAIFIDLYRRKKASDVKKYWALDDREFFKILRDLERLQLLEVLPENKYRFNISGPVRVPKNGLFRNVFFKHNIRFLEYVQDNVEDPRHILQTSEILLSEEHAKEFRAEFENLSKRCREYAFMDETVLPTTLKQSVRWLFAYAPYETDWRKL